MKRIIAMILMVMLCIGCADHDEHGHAVAGHEHAAGESDKGPHGGRLLRDGDFALELAIHEAGVPAEFRVWLYEDGKLLPPAAARVQVRLTRLDGAVDEFAFEPDGELLRATSTVREPHSFDVVVAAQSQTRRHEWTFSSYEGRTRIAAGTASAMGVRIGNAGPATLREQVTLTGAVQADPTRISRVRARYPGVVREIAVQPFSQVARGALLAQVQSNESLQNYPVTAPIAGAIVEQQAQVGEVTGDVALFTIVDITRVWVELDVFQRELNRIEEGQRVDLRDLDGRPVGNGRIARIAPLAVHGSQSVRARVVIDNAAGSLRPGQFVTGVVTVAETPVALAVERDALQRFRDFDVVFANVGEFYEVRMLELGRADDSHVEVVAGLKAGATYVTHNSYLIKADIEKSGAGHDH